MYILVFSFQFMADKDSQRNADGEEHDETAEQLQQPYAVQEMHVCGTDADEGCRKEDESSIMHQKAVEEIITRLPAERRPISLEHSLSILSAIFRQIASPSRSRACLDSLLTVTLPACCREETAPSTMGRVSESLVLSLSILSQRTRTALQFSSNASVMRSLSCIFSASGSAPSISEKSNFLFMGRYILPFWKSQANLANMVKFAWLFQKHHPRRFGIDFLRVIFSFLHSEVCFRRLCHIS